MVIGEEKMTIIYKVTVNALEKENRFHITWHQVETDVADTFEQSMEIKPGEMQRLWRKPQYRLDMGQKLFRFLDGDARHFKRALDHAFKQAESLQIHLRTCTDTADWPFELLAQEDSFLLPYRLHLVRNVSDWGKDKEMNPQDRPLKLLFMASSPIDIESELDFEQEEEAIFRVTENLAIDMEVEDSGSLEGLRTRLEKEYYDVVHLSGHAGIDKNGQPFFIMESETGGHRKISPAELWKEALIEKPPRSLFLSGCRTGEVPETGAVASFAQMLVENHNVPAVLGWGRSTADEQATHAEAVFYKELSRGQSILDAVQRARYESAEKYESSPTPAWPLLRLFSSGIPLNAVVTEEQKQKPRPRDIVHTSLKESQVQVLKEGFVGRRRQLQQSLRALNHDPDKIGVLLLGTGGLGKSCLAGKISERFTDYYLVIVHGILNSTTLAAALKDAFIISQDENGQQILSQKIEMADKLAKLCVSCFKEKNYLLILDDFEQNIEGAEKGQPDILTLEAAELLKVLLHYLRFCGKMTQLVITCRYGFTLAEKERDIVEEKLEKIWLTGFHESEQRKKERQLKNIFNYKEKSLVPDLLSAGQGNPRLMEWVDTLVGQMKAAEVPQLLEAAANKKEDFIREHVIRQIVQRGGDELTVFLSQLSIYRCPVLKDGVRKVAEIDGLEKWPELLKKGMGLSLIEHNQACQTYQLTPLMREELLSRLKDSQSCHQAAFEYYKKECEASETFDPLLVEEWIFHALGCGEEKTASEQGGRLVKHLQDRLSFRESRRVGMWILEKKKKELSNEYDASLLSETASTLKNLGEYKTAVKYFEQALAIHRAVYGKWHHSVVMDLINLGSTWGVLAGPGKAIEYYEEGLRIVDRKGFEGKHPDIVGNLWNNLGTAWNGKGDYEKAIEYYQKALTTWAEISDEGHPNIAGTLNNLGAAYNNLGKPREAADYFNQALAIDRSIFGEMHPDIAVDLNNLGAVSFDLGDRHKAIEYYEEALTILWKVYGVPHVTIAVILSNIGKAYLDMGKEEKAKKYYEDAYTIFEEIFGAENEYTKTIRSQIDAIVSASGGKKPFRERVS